MPSRRALWIVASLLLFATALFAEDPIVCITKTGNNYHTATCSYLRYLGNFQQLGLMYSQGSCSITTVEDLGLSPIDDDPNAGRRIPGSDPAAVVTGFSIAQASWVGFDRGLFRSLSRKISLSA